MKAYTPHGVYYGMVPSVHVSVCPSIPQSLCQSCLSYWPIKPEQNFIRDYKFWGSATNIYLFRQVKAHGHTGQLNFQIGVALSRKEVCSEDVGMGFKLTAWVYGIFMTQLYSKTHAWILLKARGYFYPPPLYLKLTTRCSSTTAYMWRPFRRRWQIILLIFQHLGLL